MTTNTLTEDEKMRRVPGIIFVDTPIGDRVARIAGTGLEVFEVIVHYRYLSNDWDRFRKEFDWLTEDQLRAAVTYAETFPDDIDPILEEMERFDINEFYAKNPWANPANR